MNLVNTIAQLNRVSFSANYTGSKKISLDMPKDEFIRTENNSSNYIKGYEYAKNTCIERLKENHPYEYSVAIDKDGKVLYENPGEEMHCNLIYEKLVPETTIIHGHPGEQLRPLSPTDITTLLTTPEIKTIVAVSKDGKTCSMSKPKEFARNLDRYKIDDEINELFIKNWLDSIGVSYELDEEYIKELEDKIKTQTGIVDDTAFINTFYGGYKPKELKSAFEILKFQSMMRGIRLYEPYIERYLKNAGNSNIDTKQENEILNSFLEKVAKKYGTELQYD